VGVVAGTLAVLQDSVGASTLLVGGSACLAPVPIQLMLLPSIDGGASSPALGPSPTGLLGSVPWAATALLCLWRLPRWERAWHPTVAPPPLSIRKKGSKYTSMVLEEIITDGLPLEEADAEAVPSLKQHGSSSGRPGSVGALVSKGSRLLKSSASALGSGSTDQQTSESVGLLGGGDATSAIAADSVGSFHSSDSSVGSFRSPVDPSDHVTMNLVTIEASLPRPPPPLSAMPPPPPPPPLSEQQERWQRVRESIGVREGGAFA